MDKAKDGLFLLGEDKIVKALFRLGVPTMVGMLVSALYNIADSLFVGQLGTLQLAVVSVVFPVTMIASGLGLLFGSGAGSYIAKLLGSKDYKRVDEFTSTALVTGMIVGSIIIGLNGLLTAQPAADVMSIILIIFMSWKERENGKIG